MSGAALHWTLNPSGCVPDTSVLEAGLLLKLDLYTLAKLKENQPRLPILPHSQVPVPTPDAYS